MRTGAASNTRSTPSSHPLLRSGVYPQPASTASAFGLALHSPTTAPWPRPAPPPAGGPVRPQLAHQALRHLHLPRRPVLRAAGGAAAAGPGQRWVWPWEGGSRQRKAEEGGERRGKAGEGGDSLVALAAGAVTSTGSANAPDFPRCVFIMVADTVAHGAMLACAFCPHGVDPPSLCSPSPQAAAHPCANRPRCAAFFTAVLNPLASCSMCQSV